MVTHGGDMTDTNTKQHRAKLQRERRRRLEKTGHRRLDITVHRDIWNRLYPLLNPDDRDHYPSVALVEFLADVVKDRHNLGAET